MGFLASLGIGGIVNLFANIWPVINAVIHTVEQANPEPGSGAKKFADAIDTVTGVAMSLPVVVTAITNAGNAIDSATHSGDVTKLQTALGDCINIAVKLANEVGAFQKSGFVQAVTTAQAPEGMVWNSQFRRYEPAEDQHGSPGY